MPGSLDLLSVFDTLPDAYLLLTPTLVIEAVSGSYLAATLTTHPQLVNQHLFGANRLGISEVQQRQLFGLFQSLHTHVEGTAIRLYIIKRLVKNGGGTITVQSQPNVGTTFTVSFLLPKA